jgi:hypothetical protein
MVVQGFLLPFEFIDVCALPLPSGGGGAFHASQVPRSYRVCQHYLAIWCGVCGALIGIHDYRVTIRVLSDAR